MKAKQVLVLRSIFFKLLTNLIKTPFTSLEIAYTKINENVIGQAFMTQAGIKITSLDKIKFQIWQMI